MFKKLFIAMAILISFNLFANEELEPADKCEAIYSECLEKCDTSDTQDKEVCYDKCDERYSKCLDSIKVEE